MTVRELIQELQQLDQDKGIWVIYDSGCDVFPPIPDDKLITPDEAEYFADEDTPVREGDYQIIAG